MVKPGLQVRPVSFERELSRGSSAADPASVVVPPRSKCASKSCSSNDADPVPVMVLPKKKEENKPSTP